MGAVIEGKEGVSGSNVYPTGAQSLGMFMADEGQGGSSNPIFDSEPEQQFAYNQGAGSDNFTGSLANRMTAGNLDDPNPQLLPDYLHGTGVCSNPIPAGLPASPQDWSGFGAVPDLANLVPSTGRALSRAGGVPNTGADILYFTPPLPADAEPLPAGRSLPEPKRAWTKEEEEYLVAAKMQGCTYPDISTAMNDEFKVDRSANVLSKKYREIMARNTQDSRFDQALNNAMPAMLEELKGAMRRFDPHGLGDVQYEDIYPALCKKLPGFVRKLCLEQALPLARARAREVQGLGNSNVRMLPTPASPPMVN